MARLPSLNWLRVFEAAARAQSFARAAAQLNMSAAAVSQQIKALETQLGTELFTRQAHSVTLTEAGRAYLPVVSQALGVLETATEGLFGQRQQDQVFVQAVLIFAHGILAPRLQGFAKQHPHIALNLSTGNAETDFANTFHDMKIVFGNPVAFGGQSDALMGETLYPVARPDIAERIETQADLRTVPLIEVAPHRSGWAHVFDRLGLKTGGVRWIYADSSVMAAALAAAGNGIALARAPASDAIMSTHGFVPCLPGISVPGTERYHLIYDDRRALRPAARMFRDWLLAEVT